MYDDGAHVSVLACECECMSVCVCLLKNHCFEHDSTEIIVEFALVLLMSPQPTITTTITQTTNYLIERKIFKRVWQHHRKRPKKTTVKLTELYSYGAHKVATLFMKYSRWKVFNFVQICNAVNQREVKKKHFTCIQFNYYFTNHTNPPRNVGAFTLLLWLFIMNSLFVFGKTNMMKTYYLQRILDLVFS